MTVFGGEGHMMNDLEYHKAFGDDLGGGIFYHFLVLYF